LACVKTTFAYEAIQIAIGASSSCRWQKKINRFLWYALKRTWRTTPSYHGWFLVMKQRFI
jgi:hypothetical protein